MLGCLGTDAGQCVAGFLQGRGGARHGEQRGGTEASAVWAKMSLTDGLGTQSGREAKTGQGGWTGRGHRTMGPERKSSNGESIEA